MEKVDSATSVSHIGAEELQTRSETPADSFGGNGHDQHDMDRMGKKQELRRNFEFISIVGFISILQATWESTLVASYIGL